MDTEHELGKLRAKTELMDMMILGAGPETQSGPMGLHHLLLDRARLQGENAALRESLAAVVFASVHPSPEFSPKELKS